MKRFISATLLTAVRPRCLLTAFTKPAATALNRWQCHQLVLALQAVPPLCIFRAGGGGRVNCLLSLPQAILLLWDSAGTKYVQVQEVVLQTGRQRQVPDEAVRSQAFTR